MGHEEPAPSRKSAWDWLLHPDRGLQRVLALIVTIGGVLGVGFLVYDRFIAPAQQPAVSPTQGVGDDVDLLAAVDALETGVQYSSYTALLGEPASREQLGDGFVRSDWETLDGTVTAYVDSVDEVVAYGVKALSPVFTPTIPFTGGLELVTSTFGDVTETPVGYSGVYPPSGEWWYQELIGGTGAQDFSQVLLGASYTTAVDDPAAGGIADLSSCLPYSPWEDGDGCSAAALAGLDALHITSMTVGDADDLRELAMAGASFTGSE